VTIEHVAKSGVDRPSDLLIVGSEERNQRQQRFYNGLNPASTGGLP